MCKYFDGEICNNECSDNYGRYCHSASDCVYIEVED